MFLSLSQFTFICNFDLLLIQLYQT